VCKDLSEALLTAYAFVRDWIDISDDSSSEANSEGEDSSSEIDSEEEGDQSGERRDMRLRAGANYIRSMGYMADHRRFIVSRGGYLGLGPQLSQQNDVIVTFSGCQTPFILREKRPGQFQLLGEVYLHGLTQVAWRDIVAN
jgi:hypothetical protein